MLTGSRNGWIGTWTIGTLLGALCLGAGGPGAYAQSLPSGCVPQGSTYECLAVMATPWSYVHNTCSTMEIRATEAESFQDELNTWGYACGLATTRNGWLTASRSVSFGCASGTRPSYSFGIETHNVSNYTFRYWKSCSDPTPVEESNDAVMRKRSPLCPQGYDLYSSSGVARCRREVARMEPQKSLGPPCPGCGNPINPAIGNKYQEETDYVSGGPHPLIVRRHYNSALEWGTAHTFYSAGGDWNNGSWLGYGAYGKLAMHPEELRYRLMAPDAIGAQWRHHYQRAVFVNVTGSMSTALAYRHDGRVVTFNRYQGAWVAQADVNDRLIQLPDGRFEYHVASDQSVETYSSQGYLDTIRSLGGLSQSVSYDECQRVASVIDDFGKSLQFHYAQGCGASGRAYRITAITLPGGAQLAYAYAAPTGTLLSVTFPDGTARGYTYGGPTGRLLTGIVDESVQSFASWTYDADGRAASSSHAGGAGRVSVAYTKTGSFSPLWSISRASVTDALGAVTRYHYAVVRGTNRIARIERPAPSGTGTMSEYWTYDANGNVATRRNYRNFRTNFAYDLTRNLETSRTEGLSDTGATSAETRTTTTQWHATLRLPTQVAVYAGGTATGTPVRTTAMTYDATGNLLTRAVTDPASGGTRTWSWTYDGFGRMLTADGPRTDVSDITTYTYYTCATGNQCGQLATISNAAGQVTTYHTYNAHGQPLTITDPNGVLTVLAYDARQRLLSRTVGGEPTTFSYWPTGLLKRVTQPDGSFLEYAYDAAQRLTQMVDGEGNRIVYTLDAMGNRTREQTFDPGNTLVRALSRTVDSLNRLSTEVGAAGTPAVTTSFTHDNNGNRRTTTAPLGRITNQYYDRLDRQTSIVDPASGTTAFGFDPLDNLTRVTDPRNLVTSYQYNGLGDLTRLSSPDTGVTDYTYDSGGNLRTATDARSKTATHSYDALNRLAQSAYTDQTIGYAYDAGTNGVGRLTSVTDASGSTSWSYTSQGRVSGRTQVMGAMTRTVGYGYDAAGRLQSMTLPSGAVVAYGHAAGKVSSVTVNGTTLLSDVLYEPFGGTAGWTWGNGTYAVRSYDADGKVTQIDSGGLKTYAYDDAFRITGISDVTTPANSWTYGYDPLDRLTSGVSSGTTRGWSFDANGNRLTETGSAPSTYTIAPTSNRITSISGSLPRTYAYDAAGNTTGFAGAVFGYDNRGRMTTASYGGVTASYVYNALGQRVKRALSSGTTLYVYDESGHLLGEYDGSGALIQETVWLGDIPVATLRPNGASVDVHYVHTDHLNTPRLITQPADNALRWRWDSDPFGTNLPNENPSGRGAFTYNLRFPGQLYDGVVGLHYNYFRDYDASTGRYVQSDPIGLDGGLNTYAYVGGNPLTRRDPFGLCPWCLAIPFVCGGGGCEAALALLGLGTVLSTPSGQQAARDAADALHQAANSMCSEKSREQECDENLQRDLESCAAIGRKFGSAAYKVCERQAMLRYGNCLSGRDEGIDAPLPPWSWP